jgi:hypothetical protein
MYKSQESPFIIGVDHIGWYVWNLESGVKTRCHNSATAVQDIKLARANYEAGRNGSAPA